VTRVIRVVRVVRVIRAIELADDGRLREVVAGQVLHVALG
jgi:hypothetical protein